MDDLHLGPDDAAGEPAAPARSGWTRRVVTTVAASAVLLGSGAAVGVALTGGASAATASSASVAAGSPGSSARAALLPAGRCAQLIQKLRSNTSFRQSHPAAVMRLRALCGGARFGNPLLRMALINGEHGQVTFQSNAGSKTLAFERGIIESVAGSAITVKAADGTTWTWQLTASTAVREVGNAAARASLSSGDVIFVAGLSTSGANDARIIQIRKAA
jgi:hypothetical protein